MNPDLNPRPNIPPSEKATGKEIFLHVGENPFPPHPHVLKAIQTAAEESNRYPDTNATQLRNVLAEYIGHGITSDHIIAGNGSDDLIDLMTISLSSEKQSIITFEPSFFVYGFSAERHSRTHINIPRTGLFDLPRYTDIKGEIPKNAAIAFIANPNNPTGLLTPRELLIEYIENFPGKVVIDECYFEFSNETVVDLVHTYPNVLILRSLSKSFGLSGLRVGYAIAQPDTIAIMNNHALTFPVNRIAQAAGIAVFECLERYQEHISLLIEERDTLRKAFLSAGFTVLESFANFILVMDGLSNTIEELKELLDENQVLVSDQSRNVGKPALRIASGTPHENFQVIKLLESQYS